MQERECRNFNKRGFTLVELIIVIAILAIIMLIASLAYGGIQQRMKVRSDKATCGEIGKALAVREADLDKSKGIGYYGWASPSISTSYPVVDDRSWSTNLSERGIALLEYAGVYLVP